MAPANETDVIEAFETLLRRDYIMYKRFKSGISCPEAAGNELRQGGRHKAPLEAVQCLRLCSGIQRVMIRNKSTKFPCVLAP